MALYRSPKAQIGVRFPGGTPKNSIHPFSLTSITSSVRILTQLNRKVSQTMSEQKRKITGAAFNLSKESKRMLAQVTDAHQRGVLKRLMIEAEVAAAIVPKTRERSEGNSRSGTGRASVDSASE